VNGNGSNGSGFNSRYTQPEYQAAIRSQAETLPLRQDMVTLLKYTRDNTVIGTKSTGNMPLKTVREVTAHFVEPPVLDVPVGDRIYRLRSEADIWPLHFLHILAEVGDLVSTAPGRRWRLTEDGITFLKVEAFNQLVLLLGTWWSRVNWLIAFPRAGMGDDLPDFFEGETLTQLWGYAVGESIPFNIFAEELIARTGLRWTVPEFDDPDTGFLSRSIQSMVIEILERFGVIEVNYRFREELPGLGTLSKIDTFQLTALGQALLAALRLGHD
jgi:hypothetical protein